MLGPDGGTFPLGSMFRINGPYDFAAPLPRTTDMCPSFSAGIALSLGSAMLEASASWMKSFKGLADDEDDINDNRISRAAARWRFCFFRGFTITLLPEEVIKV